MKKLETIIIKKKAKGYLFGLLFILAIGLIEKIILGEAYFGVFGIFIGFPILTIFYIFIYIKWRKALIDPYEVFRSKYLLKQGEIHHQMYYIAQYILLVVLLFLYQIFKKFF